MCELSLAELGVVLELGLAERIQRAGVRAQLCPVLGHVTVRTGGQRPSGSGFLPYHGHLRLQGRDPRLQPALAVRHDPEDTSTCRHDGQGGTIAPELPPTACGPGSSARAQHPQTWAGSDATAVGWVEDMNRSVPASWTP